MTHAARKRQFAKLERAVTYARRGTKLEAQRRLQAERLKDLRAKAEMMRDGWVPPEPQQPDMFQPTRAP